MLPDLERLIHLQRLETADDEARRRIDAIPGRIDALEARLTARIGRLEAIEQRMTEERTIRLTLEKDAAAVQARLVRFKDQLMAVKTNKEYHAVQTEIATAEAKVQEIEDRILERMLAADELAADFEAARESLTRERAAVAAERERIEADRTAWQAQVERHVRERAAVAADLPPQLLEMFETLARGRKGTAVSEVREGCCRACRVRLRPQLLNDIRANDALIQCESCQRILHFPLQADVAVESVESS